MQRLDEISLLRPIIIGLLVVMHAFTTYAGNWALPDGIEPVRAYFWIQKLSFSCMLELFVFISGYVFGFQLFGLKRTYTFGQLLLNKLKRLIVPSMAFSLLYILCFTSMAAQHQWGLMAYSTIAGYAHMWFLPMLFWCFIGGWAIERLHVQDGAVLALLAILALFSHLPLPLRLDSACYYMLFFYLGMCMYKHRTRLQAFATKHPVGLFAALGAYVLFVILQTRNIEVLTQIEPANTWQSMLLWAQKNACKLSYALIGVLIVYALALYSVARKAVSQSTLALNKYCFGIYLIQQFILITLYYHTPLPLWVGSYWLPWIGTISTMLLSYILAKGALYTRTGRFLIG